MRNIFLTLIILLLAAPAMADVNICWTTEGNLCTVVFDARGEANNVRAFALNVAVNIDANIVDFNEYTTISDYNIYPGQIDINDAGKIKDYGTAQCDPNLPGTLGMDTPNQMTVEMASLYEGSPPDACGVLFTFRVNVPILYAANDVNITANVIRGGPVVMEDPCETVTTNIGCFDVDCLKDLGGDEYDDWVILGKPDCWCYRRQCRGDTDNNQEFGLFWVFSLDLTVLAGNYGQPVTGPPGACADFDHADEFGLFRVFSNDLTILAGNYGQSPTCCDNDQDCDLDGTDKYNSWKP